jgi:fused signal recognition particle receptor
MSGFFKKLKEGIVRETPTFQKAYKKIFRKRYLDLSSIEALEESLYESDFGVETTEEIIQLAEESFKKDKQYSKGNIAELGANVLRRVLEGSEGVLENKGSPTVICLIGVNGAGKTTTTAKLGYQLQKAGNKVLVGACDTFRAAANEQLMSWTERLSLETVSSSHGADAAAVAFDSYQAGVKRGMDYLILDTAGRLHTKSNLMEELAKMKRVLAKQNGEAPQYRWLVVDGSIGSNSIEQARIFNQHFDINGLIVTKLDGTSRGGAIVGIYRELKIPIYYVGLGESEEDLRPFSIEEYVNAVFSAEETKDA